MTYPIYTYGSGYIEWYALSSIAALTSSTLFAATLKVMGLLAAFTVFIGLLSPKSPITQGGHIKIGIGFISILLVSMLIFGPKINVAVIDSVSPLAIPNGGVVNNVPIGVGLPISLASQVANGLVNGVETAFSSPAVGGPGSSTDFTSAGMGVAISMPLQSYSDSITDPTLQSNFNYYFENCIDPAIANGTVSPSEIADAGLANPINNVSNAPTTFQAQSLWSLFQSISNQIPGPGGLTTNFINPTTGSNSTVACQNDYTNVYDEASSYGQTFFQQESESLGYTSYSTVSSLLSNINQNVLNVGNDGMQEQMQAFAVNLTNSAIPQIAAASGITSTQAAYSTGLAEAGWGASIAPMLLTAQQFMPGMLSLLFVVITIASPFLLMFLMFPWGGRYLQVYMTLLLWMVLWLPMAAVINFVLQLIEHESFLYNYSVQGYSLASAGIVNHFFMGQLEIATVLMTAIPIFTYYLASASSMGMVMLAGTIDSSIKGGSMAAANSSMQGANMDNTSIGNTSMHNLSGYNDSTYSYAMGGVAMKVGQRSVDTADTHTSGRSNKVLDNSTTEGHGSYLTKGTEEMFGVNGTGFDGTITDKGGKMSFDGIVDHQALGNLIAAGDFKKGTNSYAGAVAAYKTGKSYNLEATGFAGSKPTTMKLSRASAVSGVNTDGIKDYTDKTVSSYNPLAGIAAAGGLATESTTAEGVNPNHLNYSGKAAVNEKGLNYMYQHGMLNASEYNAAMEIAKGNNGLVQMDYSGTKNRLTKASIEGGKNVSGQNVNTFNVGEHNLNAWNTSTSNLNSDSYSNIVDGMVINGKTTNAGEVTSIMSQKGLSATQKVKELLGSGVFNGSVTASTSQGESTYQITPNMATETSTANGYSTSKVFRMTPDGLVEGPIVYSKIGPNQKPVTGSLDGGVPVNHSSGISYKGPGNMFNSSFLSNNPYLSSLHKRSPGPNGIYSGIKNKDTGAFAEFMLKTQDMLQRYLGDTNEFSFSTSESYKIEAKEGASFLGNGIKSQFAAGAKSTQGFKLSANALYTGAGRQLEHYKNEYKSGKISWKQFTNDVNGLVHEYKNIADIGSLQTLQKPPVSNSNTPPPKYTYVNAKTNKPIPIYNKLSDIKTGHQGEVRGRVYFNPGGKNNRIIETRNKEGNKVDETFYY